jgi:hypothetical protein
MSWLRILNTMARHCHGVVYKYKLKALVVGSNILYYDDVTMTSVVGLLQWQCSGTVQQCSAAVQYSTISSTEQQEFVRYVKNMRIDCDHMFTYITFSSNC